MRLSIKKLHPEAVTPKRGTKDSAGLDLAPLEYCLLSSGCRTVLLPTGISVAIPSGHVGIIKARSSVFRKGLLIDGVIDADYRGEVKIMVRNASNDDYTVIPGKPIAQLIVMPVAMLEPDEVNDLGPTERGSNGFGSTDNQ